MAARNTVLQIGYRQLLVTGKTFVYDISPPGLGN
jgi:hypothetical protein